MGDDLTWVRPRLPADTYAVPTGDGVLVHTNRGTESITGATIHAWLDRLSPRLDGRATVGELIADLSPDKQDMVRRIVAALRDRGLLRDGDPGVPARPEIAYLDSFVPDATASHHDFARAELVVTGPDPIRDEVVALLAATGAGSVSGVHGGDELLVHIKEAPVVRAVRRAGCLWIHEGDQSSAAWRRARTRLDADDPGPNDPDASEYSPEAVTLAAATIAMTAFRLLTGASGAAGADTVTRLDLASLEATTHRALPWPAPADLTGGDDVTARIARLVALPALDPATLDRAGARLVEPRVGVLGEVSERDFVQLPVNVAAVTVAGRTRPVTGAGPTVATARWRAILAGLASYAVSTPDRDRLAGGRVPGWRLADGTAHPLAADRVFASPHADPPGVAAALTWSDAVTTALLDWCARLTAADRLAARPRSHPVPVRPSALALDDEAAAYLRMLDILGIWPRVLDVTGPLRVPTLAFGAGDRTVAYVSGLRAADTMPAGLLAVLLDHQSADSGQPAYAPRLVPQLPAGIAGVAASVPDDRLEPGDVVDALRGAGFDPVAVPLDHDPELARLVPFIVRVVPAHG